MTPAQHEDYEERAAIMEYDSQMPRADAERHALQRVFERTRDKRQKERQS